MYLLPLILLEKLPPRAVLIWFQAFFFFPWSLKQLSFGFQITGSCLTSSIHNATSRLLSAFEVVDWREFSYFFLPASVESSCLIQSCFLLQQRFFDQSHFLLFHRAHFQIDTAGLGGDVNWLIFSCSCCYCHNKFLINSSLTHLGRRKAVSTYVWINPNLDLNN